MDKPSGAKKTLIVVAAVIAGGLGLGQLSHNDKQVDKTAVKGAQTQTQKPQPGAKLNPLSKIEKKIEYTTKPEPFGTQTVDDSTLAAGVNQVRTEGADGVRTTTWEVTYTDGKETGRVSVNDGVTIAPVTKVIAHGTYVAPPKPNCDPNYTGCVPNVWPSDVDCAGGSGNGPYYTYGPVRVIGIDRYGLDRDGDGIACE